MKTVGIARRERRVAYRLDCADTLVVAKKDRAGKVALDETVLSEHDVIRRVQQIADLGIQTLICGAVSGFACRMFRHHGIEVIGGVIGDAQDVLDQYVRGNLRAGAIPYGPDWMNSSRLCTQRQGRKRKRIRKGCSRKGERDGKR
jgi:predicted Fe-Mo cluster-binding NifX family protein